MVSGEIESLLQSRLRLYDTQLNNRVGCLGCERRRRVDEDNTIGDIN